jgi:hypothetical protein
MGYAEVSTESMRATGGMLTPLVMFNSSKSESDGPDVAAWRLEVESAHTPRSFE